MADKKIHLRIPGPTPVPDEVLDAMTAQMINHRGPAFKDILERVTVRLKEFFQTENDLYVMTSSGTGAMEASVVNTLSPGDRVLALTIGSFGQRYVQIAEAFGADVVKLEAPYGKAINPDDVDKHLSEDPAIKAVLITHNETSTGVTNPLRSIAAITRSHDRLLLVDAISSIGSIDLPVDAWECDVVSTASQKGWMSPPGLSMISVSQRAWEAWKTSTMPRFHWDFGQLQSYLERGQTPWTPAVSTFYALDVGLEAIAQEGLANVFERHASVARRARDGARALGLSLLAEEEFASNTVTAINAPEGIDLAQLLKICREEYGVVLAGGPGPLAGKVFRIGHLGHVTENDIDVVIDTLREVLRRLGFKGSGN